MKKNFFALALICFFTLCGSSCKKDSEEKFPEEPVPIELSTSQLSLIESQNTFAFDIFRKTLENSETGDNVLISPLSISMALTMALNGADGTTREAMTEALRVHGISTENLNTSYKDLTAALLKVDKRVLISIANSIWTEESFPVKSTFPSLLTEYYYAEGKSFSIYDPLAPKQINSWVEANTNGLIKNMIDNLDDNIVMLLINAIYFKGKWTTQFESKNTVTDNFYKNSGQVSEVPMMKQKAGYKFYVGNNLKVLELPYGQGNFVMDVILPANTDGVESLSSDLNENNFNLWLSRMNKSEIDVSFPRFKYGAKQTLNDLLSEMGMGIAFTDNADFSNISDIPLLISKVLHQAFIETNEEGTEAAAATIVEIGVTSVGPDLVFRADHPFIYIIRETSTNAILFMGRVSDPALN